jgi:hypothetical protein
VTYAPKFLCLPEPRQAALRCGINVARISSRSSGLLAFRSVIGNASLEGNTRRAIDFHDGDKINEKALKALIRAAVALNTSARATTRPIRSQKRTKSA